LPLLFAIVVGFAFLSSEAAELWGLERLRMPAFLAVFGALLLGAVLRDPRLRPSDGRTPALLALLLALILAADAVQGEVDPVDYKVALVLPLLLFAPNLARALEEHDPAGLVWRLLTVYVLGTALLAVWFAPDFLLRGRPDLARVDFSGSLVAHAGLCVVYLLVTLAKIEWATRPLAAVGQLALAGLAAVSLLLTGTRTALVTCGIYGALDVAAADRPSERLARFAPALLGALVVLTGYTLLISDDFLERLLPGGSEDWSSGRAVSQLHWLASVLDQPLGLGFGFVRERLADGRPALDGTQLLEWPHNEPLRFFVEAGPAGFIFLGLLLGHLLRLAVRAASGESRPLPRATMLAIAADMLAQSLFQNYFNSVYYATGLLVVLVTLAASVEERRLHAASCRRSSAHDELPGSAATA